jgi:hypothetical protein
MTNLIHPKPRFGYNPTTGLVYDYLAGRDAAPSEEPYESVDGVWDLNEVKAAIETGHPIEGALIERVRPKPAAKAPGAPVPNKGTVKAPSKTADDGKLPDPVKSGLSVAQLIGLGLSAVQCAALQITPQQLTATGVSAEQVAGWELTPERADALKLTPQQRAVLMP